jgi:hypothetical protein
MLLVDDYGDTRMRLRMLSEAIGCRASGRAVAAYAKRFVNGCWIFSLAIRVRRVLG